jgi:4-amino-4-deoxy-L-arabinose transferase-like glycosyltransferase
MDSDVPKMQIRKSIIFLELLVVLSFLFRVIFSSTEVIYPDACTYMSISKSILNGKLFTDFRDGIDTILPPLYPLFSSGAYLFLQSYELSALVVSLLMGSLLIIPVYYLAKLIYGEKAAWISALFIFFSPVLINWSVAMYTESLFILLFVSAITVGLYALEKDKGVWFFYAGILTGLAYMTRIMGIILLAILGIWIIIHYIVNKVRYKKMVSMVLALILGFIIITAPYLLYMHSFFGKWTLTASYGSIQEVVVAEGTETVSGWELLEVKETKKSFPEMFIHKITVNLRHYSYMLFRMLTIAGLFAIIGIRGLKKGLRERESTKILFLLSVIILYFLSLLLLPPSPLVDERMRYLSPILPLLLVLSSGGIVYIAGWIGRLVNGSPMERLIAPITIIIAFLSFIPQYGIVSAGLSKPWEEKAPVDIRKQTGEWMKENLPRPIRAMSRAPFITYHAEGIFFVSPPTYEEVIGAAKAYGIDYIVVDRDVDYDLRPRLKFLFNPRIVPKDFKLIGGYTHPTTGEILTAVYRIEK